MEALKMETPMDNWNDERLDELGRRMDEGFKEMREGFARMEERFATKEDISEVKGEVSYLGERFDRLLHTLALISWGVAGTLLAALVSVLVTVLL